MTPTFIVDRADEHRPAVRVDRDMPDDAANAEILPASGTVGRGTILGRGFRRVASLLFSPLRERRRRLPPQDDFLRRDVGLPQRETRRNHWEYWNDLDFR
ncbi:hypothetical protein [Mesorhizobium shangrilense]|uniref:DUF1127 domain-containing protein n=1 Tax=Mesorhizobium shangrilense TaxID=460060 RepID=A0ABV2DKI6_9HYPH